MKIGGEASPNPYRTGGRDTIASKLQVNEQHDMRA